MTILFQDFFTGSSLNAAWSRRSIVSGVETWLGPGLTVANLGAGDFYLMNCPAGDFAVELEYTGKTTSSFMCGPAILDGVGTGMESSSYSSPAEVLNLGVSTYAYSGTFNSAVGTNLTAGRVRLTKVGGNYTTAYSTNGGASWSAESSPLAPSFTPTKVGIGCIFGGGAGSITLVELKVTSSDASFDTTHSGPAKAGVVPAAWTADSSAAARAASAIAGGVAQAFSNAQNGQMSAQAAVAIAGGVASPFQAVIPVGTDTANALDGRSRGGLAAVTIIRPTSAAPTNLATKVDKAMAYPVPTMVDGRPT